MRVIYNTRVILKQSFGVFYSKISLITEYRYCQLNIILQNSLDLGICNIPK